MTDLQPVLEWLGAEIVVLFGAIAVVALVVLLLCIPLGLIIHFRNQWKMTRTPKGPHS